MNAKKYLIDSIPASARDIMDKAKEYDPDFGSDGLFRTSTAAVILRKRGHSVEANMQWKD